MKTHKFDNVLYWILFFVMILVLLVLVLVTVKPAGAASICPAPAGALVIVDKALTQAGVPHTLGIIYQRSRMTCWRNGSPVECPLTCGGWYLQVGTARIEFSSYGSFVRVR